jgi:hypothetical protein
MEPIPTKQESCMVHAFRMQLCPLQSQRLKDVRVIPIVTLLAIRVEPSCSSFNGFLAKSRVYNRTLEVELPSLMIVLSCMFVFCPIRIEVVSAIKRVS